MVNKYYRKHKERLHKEAREWHQNLSEEQKEKDIKILLKKKKKKGASIIKNVSKSYVRIEEIII